MKLFLEPPSPPVGPLEFKDIQRSSVTVSWKPSEDDGGSPVTHYLVEKREKTKSTWSYLEKIKSTTTRYTMTHLIEKTEYFVRVKSENKAGLSEPLEGQEPVIPKNPFSKLSLKTLIYTMSKGSN